jgi:hypothetical protein
MVSIKEFPRGINSDQVISLGLKPTGRLQGVHPGPGLKLGEMDIASSKPKASSAKLLEPQATSIKPQAQRLKLQATSCKLLDLGSWKKFQAPLIKGLYLKKCPELL